MEELLIELDLDKKSIVLGASKVGIYINIKGSYMVVMMCVFKISCVCG